MSRLLRKQVDDGLFDLEFWARVGAEGRFAAAWEMVAEVDRFRSTPRSSNVRSDTGPRSAELEAWVPAR